MSEREMPLSIPAISLAFFTRDWRRPFNTRKIHGGCECGCSSCCALLHGQKERCFLGAADANTSKLKHCGTRAIEGCVTDVQRNVIPFKIKLNVPYVKNTLLSTRKLPKQLFAEQLRDQHRVKKGTMNLSEVTGLLTFSLRLWRRSTTGSASLCSERASRL